MARVNPKLFAKLQSKLNLKPSRLYDLIGETAVAHTQPKNIAALMLASENGIDYFRFASPDELTALQNAKNRQPIHQPAPAVHTGPVPIARALPKRKPPLTKTSTKREDSVFLVHGRDSRAREALTVFLRSLRVDVIEWEKALQLTGKANPYIGEVIDAGFAHAQAVVVLFTPDDEARLKTVFVKSGDGPVEKNLTGQPRQNVLFEAGLAFGRDKERTILVQVGTIRPMSDVSGIYIVHLTDSSTSRKQFIGKLKATHVKYDDSGADWLTHGDFSKFK